MDEDLGKLAISLRVDEDVSALEMEELTAALRRELLQLDVEGVDRISSGPAPDGAKGIELAEIGALIVKIGSTAPVLGQVVEVIRAWAARSPKRTVTMSLGGDTITLENVSEKDQHLAIKDWMARHPVPIAEAGTEP